MKTDPQEPLDAKTFRFWTPPAGRSLTVGPEKQQVPLPQIPLPVERENFENAEPGVDAIGQGLYAYLRQFPDCPHNVVYAEVLRDAFPHFMAEIGSQIVMLDAKEVDPLYVRRKITYLKILLLLEPQNPGLLQQLGVSCYHVGLMFPELEHCRFDLLKAMKFLQRALKIQPDDLTTRNYLGQIDFLFGDYPGARRHWRAVVENLEQGQAYDALAERIARIECGEVPQNPVIDSLEELGGAESAFAGGYIEDAKTQLEKLEEDGVLPEVMPMPEFFHFLGLCRERTGDLGGAFEAFEKAIALDPGYTPAREGRERILG